MSSNVSHTLRVVDLSKRMSSRVPLAIGLLGLVGASLAAQAQVVVPPRDDLPATASPRLWERSRLTGDWGGARTKMEAAGINLDFETTGFYEGPVSGSGSKSFDLGGRLDGFVKLDTGKLGLWGGGGLVAHLEYTGGSLSGSLGKASSPRTRAWTSRPTLRASS